MEKNKDNTALSISMLISIAIHVALLLIIPFKELEALFAGYGNNYTQTQVQMIRLTGSGVPKNKGAEKTEEPSRPEEKPKGNVEDKPAPKTEVEPKKTVEKTVPKESGETSKPSQPAPKPVRSDTEAVKPEPPKEEAPEVKVITSDVSEFAIDFDAMPKEAQGQAIADEGKGGNASSRTGEPDGTSDKVVPAKGEDYITNHGGSGGFTTKNIQSLEFTGVLEMFFEVDSEGELTVVLVQGLGDERFNKELVSFAQKSWRGRFDDEAKARFPNGYKVPVTVVFEKGNGTHKFGNVEPLE
ncbi:MAG TPA: hypothetical protein GX522_05115 [Firmicutes bacterium]|nr:hypothetical protein [Bacillota bacterium]